MKKLKLKKIKVSDMLDDRYYWVQEERMICSGAQWKLTLQVDREVNVYEFSDYK